MATKKPIIERDIDGNALHPYVVLVAMGAPDSGERWAAGSQIMLSDDKAALHIAAGNVAPRVPEDAPPPLVADGPVTHFAPAKNMPEVIKEV